jgi:hypothetical protein
VRRRRRRRRSVARWSGEIEGAASFQGAAMQLMSIFIIWTCARRGAAMIRIIWWCCAARTTAPCTAGGCESTEGLRADFGSGTPTAPLTAACRRHGWSKPVSGFSRGSGTSGSLKRARAQASNTRSRRLPRMRRRRRCCAPPSLARIRVSSPSEVLEIELNADAEQVRAVIDGIRARGFERGRS